MRSADTDTQIRPKIPARRSNFYAVLWVKLRAAGNGGQQGVKRGREISTGLHNYRGMCA